MYSKILHIEFFIYFKVVYDKFMLPSTNNMTLDHCSIIQSYDTNVIINTCVLTSLS